MIPKQLKILAVTLLMVSLGGVVLIKAILKRLVGHTDTVLRISFILSAIALT
jgi:hypothetical protein